MRGLIVVYKTFSSVHRRGQKKKIDFYHLFDAGVENEFPQILEYGAENHRLLPNEYSAPGAVDVFGDYVNVLLSICYNGFGGDFSFTVIMISK